MKTILKVDTHTAASRGLVVEIHHPVYGFIGAIYPSERGVRIISKYLDPRRPDPIEMKPGSPAALEVFLVSATEPKTDEAPLPVEQLTAGPEK